jgi:hypothetical protein
MITFEMFWKDNEFRFDGKPLFVKNKCKEILRRLFLSVELNLAFVQDEKQISFLKFASPDNLDDWKKIIETYLVNNGYEPQIEPKTKTFEEFFEDVMSESNGRLSVESLLKMIYEGNMTKTLREKVYSYGTPIA